jgi:Zn-dependent M28 family amino/carboxypeptidase
MPGDSFEGAPPPATPVQEACASRLRGHVVALAGEIGERNLAHYAALERARAYVADALSAAGWAVTDQAYEFGGETFHNVEAARAGDAALPEIVVGAHYDSVEGSPGANDNASGVALLIELARAMRDRPSPRALRLVAFANEEPPYFNDGRGMGSVEYVRRLSDPGRVRAMLSLETVGYYRDEPGSQHYPAGIGALYPDRGNFVGFVANVRSRALVRDVVRSFRAVATIPSEGAALPESIPGVGWSDHRSFWAAGIPAVMVTDTAPFRDPAYHRATDTPERLDYDRMARVVDGLAHALGELSP